MNARIRASQLQALRRDPERRARRSHKEQLARSGLNRTWWRSQAAREERRVEVHEQAIEGKRCTVGRYRELLVRCERAALRMRGFALSR